MKRTKIYLDADACPVRKEAEKIAERFGVKLVVVSNGGIRPSRDEMIETIIVANGPDAADDATTDPSMAGIIKTNAGIPEDEIIGANSHAKHPKR